MKNIVLMVLMMQSFQVMAATKVFFVTPKNKEKVEKKFNVEFGVEGMSTEKAGVMKEMTGHHHLIIDGKFVEKGMVVPKDENHKHFGDGSSKTSVELTPGTHKLTLQFADGAHKSYGEEMSATIEVEVKGEAKVESKTEMKK